MVYWLGVTDKCTAIKAVRQKIKLGIFYISYSGEKKKQGQSEQDNTHENKSLIKNISSVFFILFL
jgi:hypothetical protein